MVSVIARALAQSAATITAASADSCVVHTRDDVFR